MAPTACVNMHAFAGELQKWEEGVPVDCGAPWAWETVEAAVEKGAHKSATSDESIALVQEDVAYQLKAGYAEIIAWKDLQKLRPKQLKISPLAVVPQRNRRGRMILDLSFAVRARRTHRKDAKRGQTKKGRKRSKRGDDDIIQASVNDTTTRLAPEGPVKELGNVLPRLLDFMATVPPEEHIHFSKLDLADGYWRMRVTREERWNFAYVMPAKPGEELMVVVPSALQMGWNESPAFFCATTETVRDISQMWMDHGTELPAHKMEAFVKPATPPQRQLTDGATHQWSGVYVDDHLLAVVEDRTGTLMRRTARATLHAIHSVFTSPSSTTMEGAKDPISEKKLHKGDGRFDTTKEILGYMLDGIARTIQLPQDRADNLLKEVRAILKKTRVPLTRFRSIVGRLQHAARILPVAKAFFTPLYNALRGLPSQIALGAKSEVRQALIDAAVVIRDLARRPTHVSELTQHDLHYTGYCDASAFGAGGVWFGADRDLTPIVWRVQWPKDITDAVVSFTNPNGRITNSDLEMAGVVLQEAALEAHLGTDLTHVQMAIGCDNSPAVAWTTRMATRSHSPIAFRLLKGLAMRQRTTHAAPPAVFHVAGIRNTLADVASRVIPGVPPMETTPGSVCPGEFLTHFDSSYPLQQLSWTNVQPPSDLWSNVIMTLRGQQLPLQRWTTAQNAPSPTGPDIAEKVAPTRGCEGTVKPLNKSASCPLPPGFELESSDMRSKLDTNLWKKPCVTWHKPSSWLGTTTHERHSAPPI
jgi:hypothetical protein